MMVMARRRRLGVVAALGAAVCLSVITPLLPTRGTAFLVHRSSHIVVDQASRGRRGVLAPCRRRASTGGCVEESQQAASPLQVPEANYFATEAAEHCIEDGCPVEVVESLAGRLERDEPRIEAAIEQLKSRSEASGAAGGAEQEIEWLQHFLEQSRDLRERLHGAISQNFNAAKDVAGFVGLGSGSTGGILYKRPRAVTH
mmetsp:Transcript_37932/g.109434  ORF Transcript_37932/g.109434 Transcript_37932/m.109434 type:complete len:200 (-) Transcript_37932:148-747(-)